MRNEIKEYSEALEGHLADLQAEIQIKDKTRKSYYRLVRAKEAMRDRERQIIEESERNL